MMAPINNNHGKKWTPKEDEHIMDTPELPDSHFAQILRRSEEAVKCRRAVLAAKLHKSTEQPIQYCAEQLHADVGRTTVVVNNEGKGGVKEARSGKIKPYKASAQTPSSSTFSTRSIATPEPSERIYTAPRPPPSSILTICEHIKRTGGDIDGIWAQDALVSTLVQFHLGFQSYALFIAKGKQQAAASSKAVIRFKGEPAGYLPRTTSITPTYTPPDAPSSQPSDTHGCSSTPGDTGSASSDPVPA